MPGPVVMLRVATLSVPDAAAMIDTGRTDDPLVLAAIRTATDQLSVAEGPAADSTLRYVARMGGRATPFGLFAGTAMADVGQQRDLRLDAAGRHRVTTRIDAAALADVVAAGLAERPAADRPLRINPLARMAGGLIRFPVPGDVSADVRQLKAGGFVVEVLRRLGSGERTAAELTTELSRWRPELPTDRIAAALADLVAAALLVPATGLIQPGREPLSRAADCLGADDGRTSVLTRLAAATCGDRSLADQLELDLDAEWNAATAGLPELAELPSGRRFDHQVSLAMARRQLDLTTVDDLIGAVARLQLIGGRNRPGAELARFTETFQARYEDAEVPLLDAIDLETGVLPTPGRSASRVAAGAAVSYTGDGSDPAVDLPHEVLDAYRRAAGGRTVDIGHLPRADQPSCRALLACLLDRHQDRYSAVLVGGMGRSPLALMARFGLDRPEVAEAFPAEQPDDALRVELVHNPGGRIANVLIRPAVLTETIALAGASGGTFSLDRLTLRLADGRLRLRDRVTGRPVLIELHSAHNVDLAGLDPAYALLGRLAGGQGVSWDWAALAGLDHLPRVSCGSVIVAPEQWRLTAAQVKGVLASAQPAATLRRELGVEGAGWLGSGSYDHVLPLDPFHDASVRIALGRAAAGTRIIELPQLDSPATRGETGGHVTEAVIGFGPLHRTAPPPPAGDLAFDPATGGAWAYARLHCGVAGADTVLAAVESLVARLRASGLVEDWFFVRYPTEGHHLRVRLRGANADQRPALLVELIALGEQLRSEGLVTRVVLDDYVPEVTRYGGRANLTAAHRLFTASSDQVAGFLAGGPDESGRIHRAVADIVAWARRFSADEAEQIGFVTLCRDGLGVRFARTGNRHGKLIRAERPALDAALAIDAGNPATLAALDDLLAGLRRDAVAERAGSVIGSALHLHCNRLFAFDAVRLEYVSHELAVRRLRELHARAGRVSA